MFIYRIAQNKYNIHYGYEILLTNDKCYNHKEFKNLIKDIVNSLSEKQKMNHNTIYELEDILIEQYGFKPYEIPIQASVYDEWDIKDLD